MKNNLMAIFEILNIFLQKFFQPIRYLSCETNNNTIQKWRLVVELSSRQHPLNVI